MNYLDAVLCIPLLWGLYIGFRKGLIIELATLIALGLGVFCAGKFSPVLAQTLKAHVGWKEDYLPVITFALIFLAVVLFVFLVAKLLEKFIKIIALAIPNRLAGSVFAFVKYMLLLSVALFILEHYHKTAGVITKKTKESSVLYKPVACIAPIILPGLETFSVKAAKDSLNHAVLK